MRNVLFVDDEPNVLESLRDALRSRRQDWNMAFATGAEAALEEMDRDEYQVVVSDMRMPGMDGAALLGEVQRRRPDAVRIVLSGYAEFDVVARAAAYAHRFLAKPCDVSDLTRVVERSCTLVELTQRESLRRAAASATRLPCVPSVYRELTALLEDPGATVHDAALVIEQDVAIAAKVLQLANSAFLGRSRGVTQLGDAVADLGLSTLKALTLSAGSLQAFDVAGRVEGFSVEDVQQHGALVARIARQLLVSPRSRDNAAAAALLHDVGLLVLATQEADYLADVLAAARSGRRPVAEVEYERRGLSHAEVGAHLLDLWGLPHEVVEAVAFHHRPQRAQGYGLDAVAAVAIANALVNELVPNGVDDPLQALDPAYLQQLGVADRVGAWRELAAKELDGR